MGSSALGLRDQGFERVHSQPQVGEFSLQPLDTLLKLSVLNCGGLPFRRKVLGGECFVEGVGELHRCWLGVSLIIYLCISAVTVSLWVVRLL